MLILPSKVRINGDSINRQAVAFHTRNLLQFLDLPSDLLGNSFHKAVRLHNEMDFDKSNAILKTGNHTDREEFFSKFQLKIHIKINRFGKFKYA